MPGPTAARRQSILRASIKALAGKRVDEQGWTLGVQVQQQLLSRAFTVNDVEIGTKLAQFGFQRLDQPQGDRVVAVARADRDEFGQRRDTLSRRKWVAQEMQGS